jgi:predicted Zn-ribbon and HTH transcriptional regulator
VSRVSLATIREVLEDIIEQLSARSRLPLTLELAQRPRNASLRLSSSQLRKIRKSLLFIADSTPIARTEGKQLLVSPNVCIELGYALQNKRSGQILLVREERLIGQFPFDLASHQQLSFKTATELQKTLPTVVETLLSRFKLLS